MSRNAHDMGKAHDMGVEFRGIFAYFVGLIPPN